MEEYASYSTIQEQVSTLVQPELLEEENVQDHAPITKTNPLNTSSPSSSCSHGVSSTVTSPRINTTSAINTSLKTTPLKARTLADIYARTMPQFTSDPVSTNVAFPYDDWR